MSSCQRRRNIHRIPNVPIQPLQLPEQLTRPLRKPRPVNLIHSRFLRLFMQDVLPMLHGVFDRRADPSMRNLRAKALEVAVVAVAVLRIVGGAVLVLFRKAFGARDGAVGVVCGQAGFFFDVQHLACFRERGGEAEEGFRKVRGEVTPDGHGYGSGVIVIRRLRDGCEVGVGRKEAGWDCEGGVEAFEPCDTASVVVCFFAGLALASRVDPGYLHIGGAQLYADIVARS